MSSTKQIAFGNRWSEVGGNEGVSRIQPVSTTSKAPGRARRIQEGRAAIAGARDREESTDLIDEAQVGRIFIFISQGMAWMGEADFGGLGGQLTLRRGVEGVSPRGEG